MRWSSSQRFFPAMAPPWTAAAALPGGDFGHDEVAARISALARDYPFLPQRTVRRLFHAYGTRAADVLGKARNREDLGQDFGAGLTSREVNYLVEKELAQNSDDVLWRRSKLGLRLLPEERVALEFLHGRTFRPVARFGSCFSSCAKHRSREEFLRLPAR